MQHRFTGKCTYTHNTQSIDVTYKLVPILGSGTKNYKKTIFECSLCDECPDSNNCPIYHNAPVCITE